LRLECDSRGEVVAVMPHERPRVYLDHYAIRALTEDRGLGSEFALALDETPAA